MKLTVKNPCEMDWNGMDGTERKRFCDSCSKHVHDLSELDEAEARELLAAPGVCVRFATGPDGQVRFRDSRVPTATALVMAAVMAATPAFAGGKAAETADTGSWSDWIVEWLSSPLYTMGEPPPVVTQQTGVQPIPEIGPGAEPVVETTPPPVEHFLMGDVAEIAEPALEAPPATDARCEKPGTTDDCAID